MTGDLVPDTGDDLLSQFVRPDFDSKVFVQKCIQQNTVADDHANLKQGIAVLESQLREQVCGISALMNGAVTKTDGILKTECACARGYLTMYLQVVSHHGRLIEQVSGCPDAGTPQQRTSRLAISSGFPRCCAWQVSHAKDLEELVNTVSAGVARLQSSLGSVKVALCSAAVLPHPQGFPALTLLAV